MFCQLVREFESRPVHFLILFQNFEKLSSKIGVSSNLIWAQKTSYPTQGVLRLIWSGRLECVFVDPKGAKISKNGNKITCRLSKNKHFLFYTQGRGGNIMPATPS